MPIAPWSILSDRWWLVATGQTPLTDVGFPVRQSKELGVHAVFLLSGGRFGAL
jgi:hypothetical protein